MNGGNSDEGRESSGDEPAPSPPPAPNAPPESVVLIWQSLAARRIAYDSMMWQTPSVGLTAQAFLLTLALGGQSSDLGRSVSAGLAGSLAVITLQLMAKHRQHETRDSKLLEQIEEQHRFAELVGLAPHAFARPQQIRGLRPGAVTRRFRRYSSFRLWMAGQMSFLAVALVVLILVITGHSAVLAAR